MNLRRCCYIDTMTIICLTIFVAFLLTSSISVVAETSNDEQSHVFKLSLPDAVEALRRMDASIPMTWSSAFVRQREAYYQVIVANANYDSWFSRITATITLISILRTMLAFVGCAFTFYLCRDILRELLVRCGCHLRGLLKRKWLVGSTLYSFTAFFLIPRTTLFTAGSPGAISYLCAIHRLAWYPLDDHTPILGSLLFVAVTYFLLLWRWVSTIDKNILIDHDAREPCPIISSYCSSWSAPPSDDDVNDDDDEKTDEEKSKQNTLRPRFSSHCKVYSSAGVTGKSSCDIIAQNMYGTCNNNSICSAPAETGDTRCYTGLIADPVIEPTISPLTQSVTSNSDFNQRKWYIVMRDLTRSLNAVISPHITSSKSTITEIKTEIVRLVCEYGASTCAQALGGVSVPEVAKDATACHDDSSHYDHYLIMRDFARSLKIPIAPFVNIASTTAEIDEEIVHLVMTAYDDKQPHEPWPCVQPWTIPSGCGYGNVQAKCETRNDVGQGEHYQMYEISSEMWKRRSKCALDTAAVMWFCLAWFHQNSVLGIFAVIALFMICEFQVTSFMGGYSVGFTGRNSLHRSFYLALILNILMFGHRTIGLPDSLQVFSTGIYFWATLVGAIALLILTNIDSCANSNTPAIVLRFLFAFVMYVGIVAVGLFYNISAYRSIGAVVLALQALDLQRAVLTRFKCWSRTLVLGSLSITIMCLIYMLQTMHM